MNRRAETLDQRALEAEVAAHAEGVNDRRGAQASSGDEPAGVTIAQRFAGDGALPELENVAARE
jgi:hypothetical protein